MNPELQAILDQLKNVENPFTFVYLALVVGALVRFLKSKKVSDLLDRLPPKWLNAIPKDKLPWLAVGIGAVLAFLDAKLNAKLPWQQSLLVALAGAVLSGGGAIGGHETIAKLLGSIFPSITSGGGGSSSGGTDTKDEKPKTIILPRSQTGLAKWMAIPFALTLAACALFGDPKTATKTVLSVADIVCLETGNGSAITDAKEAARICNMVNKAQDVAPELIDIIDKLIGQREAGKRAGYVWHPAGITETIAKDAGRD